MKLIETLQIGRDHRIAPSRVMFGPHETNLGDRRSFSHRHVAYYERRARGGCGIIVVEEASVHPSDWPYERAPLASECGPGWSAIARAVAAAKSDSIVLAGLGHNGGQGTSHWSQLPIWAPSAVPEVASREVPKVMERQDILDVIAGFRDATASAVASGLDGVEINAGQFSLIRQFLSGLTNMRADEYGTDRLAFAREVLREVRAAAGNAIVALRLSVDEMAPWAGIVPEAGAQIAVELAPFVDLITVVRGSIYTGWATRPDQHVEAGFGLGLARQVREALTAQGLHTPVFAQGSIVDWGQAEWAVGDGAADGVEMTRAQLADAELVNKVRLEKQARIRPCVLCNQTCKVRDNRNPIITCIVDPRTGHETEDADADVHLGSGNSTTPTPSNSPLARAGKVLHVIGGGVAGLETARVAALRGFQVTVHEASSNVGGVANIAALGAGRDRLANVSAWLANELTELNVELRLNDPISQDALDKSRSEGSVVVATGGTSGTLPFPIDSAATWMHAIEALEKLAEIRSQFGDEQPIVVWDPIGGPIAISIAETLAQSGNKITLVTPDLLVGEKLSLTGDLAPAQPRLHGLKITLTKRALVRAVNEESVTIEDKFSGVVSDLPCSLFIACGHRLPDQTLDPDELLAQAGDRVAPRTIHEAILEGRRAAFALR